MISINWATKVITIQKVDMNQIQANPTEIYELSIDLFRLTLKDLEDDTEGISFPSTHNHNPPVSVGGVTLARVVEIINDYTVTFEDGQYAVNLVGANSNIADRVNVNQVSIRVANSAGLVQTREIEHASFNGRVTIDVDNGSAGTSYPIGTPTRPVNNIADALFIASLRGFKILQTLTALTIPTGANIDDYTIQSTNWLAVTVEPGVSLLNTNFEKVSLYGEMSSVWNVLIDCWIYDISNFSGWVRGGSIGEVGLAVGTINAEFGGQSFFDDIVPLYPGNISVVTMNSDTQVSFTNCKDATMIQSMTANSTVNCGLIEGILIIDSTCTGGDITVGGVGVLVNNSALSVDDEALVNSTKVATKVWVNPTRTLTSGGGGSGATPAEIWAYSNRTLTEGAGLTTEEHNKLFSLKNGGGGTSIVTQTDDKKLEKILKKSDEIYKKVSEVGDDVKEVKKIVSKISVSEEVATIKKSIADSRTDILKGISDIDTTTPISESTKAILDAMSGITSGIGILAVAIDGVNTNISNNTDESVLESIDTLQNLITGYSESITTIETHLVNIDKSVAEYPERIKEVNGTIVNIHADISKNIESIKNSSASFSRDSFVNMNIVKENLLTLSNKMSEVKNEILADKKEFQIIVED